MRVFKSSLVVALYFSLISTACAQVGKVTVVVSDYETGEPLSGVDVSVGFDQYDRGGSGPENVSECTTDIEGRCSMWGHGNGGSAAVAVVTSQEYYGTSEMIRFDERLNLIQRLNPIDTPWNPTIELCLKKKKNPIPMYAMRLNHGRLPEEFRVEVFDRENKDFVEGPAETLTVSWDLEKGDWVEPYGKGEIADFIFKIHREARVKYISEYGGKHLSSGATVEISFSNEGDGFIPYPVPEKDRHRSLRMPYEAPAEGYQPWEPWEKRSAGGQTADMNYFFRVRAVKDQSGKIISALYGKIYGDFQVGGVGNDIDYTYYLNPTPNDRNVEFKVKSNLFTDLRGTKDPNEP